MAVQVGFVVGAFLSALFNIADIVAPRALVAGGAFAGAVATTLIAFAVHTIAPALVLRFITGAALALVYPVGMKIMATWMKEDRGLGLGLLVGALTIGKASPYLLKIFGEIRNWQNTLYLSAALAVAGGLIVLRFVEQGPYKTAAPPFRWRYIAEALRQRGVRLANFGYLGHMWELYAMWTWLPLFLSASFAAYLARDGGATGHAELYAALVAFAAIAAGGPGSFFAGYLADRWGRTRTTIASMLISGGLSLAIGLFFGAHPAIVSVLALLWGFAVVADSAQFSSSVSELCTREYMGTALTIQTSMGFLLTMISIRIMPAAVDWIGWRWAFAVLAFGPAFGIWAMWALKRSDDALKLAGGRG